MSERQETRDQLLDVAHQVFAHYGIRKTTLDDIAVKFGKGKTAIYYYYSSREEIFRAVLDKEVSTAISQIRIATMAAKSQPDQIKAYVDVRLKVASQTPVLNEAIQEMKLKSSEWIDQLSQKYQQDKIDILTRILQEGIDGEIFKLDNPHLVAMAIETALKGLDAHYLTNGMDNQHRDKLINLLFYGLMQ